MLLALDDETGKFIANSYKYRCGLAASILLDLYQNNVIIVKRKKHFFFDYAAVSYNPEIKNVHPLYESVVDDFKRHEPQRISYWVKRIIRKQLVAFETAIIESLIALGILEKVSSRNWLSNNRFIIREWCQEKIKSGSKWSRPICRRCKFAVYIKALQIEQSLVADY